MRYRIGPVPLLTVAWLASAPAVAQQRIGCDDLFRVKVENTNNPANYACAAK